MKKQWMLIRVLMKCGKIGKPEKTNSAVGDLGSLVTVILGLAFAAATFLLGRYAGENETLGDMAAVMTTIMTVSALAAFFMSFMTAVNQLYLSSDLDVLVTLPFTPMQIVTAKLVSVSVLPAAICACLNIPLAVGYFTVKQGLPWSFIPVMVLGTLLETVYVVSLVGTLLMVLMRVFRFIRNRNIISVISTLFVFLMMLGYSYFVNSHQELDEQQAVNAFHTAQGISGSLTVVFPLAGWVVKGAMGDGISLLYALGITALSLAVLLICAKYLYFSAALGMTDASGKHGKVSEAAMRKFTGKSSVSKTLFRREIRLILRTPALITNGYLLSIVLPFVIMVPIVLKIVDTLKESMAEQGIALTVNSFRTMLTALSIPPELEVVVGSLIGLFMASMAVAFSSLSRFVISREGKDFDSLKAMPLSPRTLVSVKRWVAFGFNGISGWLIPSLLFLAAGIVGFIPAWVSLVCAIVNFAWLLFLVDLCALRDVKKPNLHWESEGDVTKNNIPGVIAFFVVLALVIALLILCLDSEESASSLNLILAAALTVAPVALGIGMEAALRKAADRLF